MITDIYPSSYEEWQPVECILGFMDVLHGSIGELQYAGRRSIQLAEAGIFFYDHYYQLLDKENSHGALQEESLPTWGSLDWPIPHGSITESYRAKLFAEVARSLKPGSVTRIVKISICMPIGVFVELFSKLQIKVSKTMLSFKVREEDELQGFLDAGWDRSNSQHVICEVNHKSISIKYMIASQNFIMSFAYKRKRYIGGQLVSMDEDEDSIRPSNNVLEISVFEGDSLLCMISLNESCTLTQLRHDINTETGITTKYSFVVNNRKVLYSTQI